jgi:hypothetical protein
MKRSSFKRPTYQEALEKAILKACKAIATSKTPIRAKLKRGSMVCPIPPEMRLEMANDPFYKKSALSGRIDNIQWHHNLIYNKRRVNEIWAIIPLTEDEHRKEAKHKDKLNWIMLNRATDEELKKYSKAVDYIALRERLNKVYGIYHFKR